MSERTPEERERARLEREARRAARARGERMPKERGSLLGGLFGGRAGRDKAAAPDQAPPPDLPVEPPAEAPARPEPPRQPEPPRPAAASRGRAGSQRVDIERIRRITAQRRARMGGLPPGGPPAGGPPREGGPARRRGRILAGVGIAILLLAGWFLASIFQPFKGEGEGKVQVSIPTGAGVGEIGDILAEEGVVASATFFKLRATLDGARGDLKPGTYTLRNDMSYGAAIDALSAGPPNDIIRVVIPEGRSRSEIAQLVKEAGLEGDYERATRRTRILDLADYKADGARDLEGFLWPATYELKRGASVRTLVNKQLRAFEAAFKGVSMRRARRANLTPYDILIIASMIEREAMLDKERRLISSVIWNRLRRGEPLGIDATIRFALGNWSKPLKQSELQSDNPYNTRNRAGLPPGPIGNPGLASIKAAANPADTDYLFYVVKPNTCGEHAFSETLAEFERDAARYNAEREKRGGRSPTDCE